MDIIVNVFGEIGYEATLADVLNPIAKATKQDTIIVNINSYGGEVNTGFAMYDALVASPAKVITRNIGVAMSAAATVLMAGDIIEALENSSTMVHMAWTSEVGNADVLQAKAAELQAVDKRILTIFKKRRGIDTASEAFQNAYKTEKQMPAKEAKALGLIDKIVATNKKTKALQPNKAYAYLDNSILNYNKNEMSKISQSVKALLEKGKTLFANATAVMNATSTIKLADGMELLYTSPEGSESLLPEVGGVITLTDGNYAPAGNHTLETGTVITIDEAGVITAVETEEGLVTEEGESVTMDDYKIVFKALQEAHKTIETLNLSLANFKAIKASGKPNAIQNTVKAGATKEQPNDPAINYLNRLAEKANKS